MALLGTSLYISKVRPKHGCVMTVWKVYAIYYNIISIYAINGPILIAVYIQGYE